jgi:collagenase-like PrtC family protease
VILSDQSVIAYAREKGMPVHLSTQLNISNIETVKFYAAFADVMVLARELTLEQVAYIAGQIGQQQITGPSGRLIQLELFVHGHSVWPSPVNAISACINTIAPPTAVLASRPAGEAILWRILNRATS